MDELSLSSAPIVERRLFRNIYCIDTKPHCIAMYGNFPVINVIVLFIENVASVIISMHSIQRIGFKSAIGVAKVSIKQGIYVYIN